MEDFTPVYHGFQPGTGLRCTLHRKKQRQQTTLIGCARILAQRLAERKVLGLAVGGKTRRVGREKCERCVLILTIFGEVEMHPPDEVPRRVAALERSEEHTSELQSRFDLVCRLL